jgi:hypothetical protein
MGMEGGHVHGRDEVRSWTHQWTMVDPQVEPVAFARGLEGIGQLPRFLTENAVGKDLLFSKVFEGRECPN